ncbi:hypothetical protein [Cohnella abietis]|uniref:Uncharacterized protein n=1 Tax=Cohnella abietis TaxID=2507935 RepID=A0A3T1D4X2_9BACL|nr:hypothetical protein [Cohnella abietis]BBI33166.1 hypothetical protein KCTCHS21_25650 [Cohnella abietis]
MKDEENSSSVWSKYLAAKESAFGSTQEDDIHLSLEELEAVIAETAASSGLPETGMPPRSNVHPSSRRQLSRWFYLALVVLFSALVIGLFWWGREHYAE